MSEQQKRRSPTILETIAHYYADRLRAFGTTPQGVDWNSGDSQVLRFTRLLQVLQSEEEVSLNDYGCGYGALVDYLGDTGRRLTYRGFDISEPMIVAARARHAGSAWCSFTADRAHLPPADYTVASGIFNVKLDHPVEMWRDYVMQTVTTLESLSTRGFAFNMLSTYSDPDKRREDLFYADPLQMFDVCKRRFSSWVSLLHDYPLYEFTIIVRK
jgi:SAM-dependent methyltransferase